MFRYKLRFEHAVSSRHEISLFLQVFYVQAVHQKVRRQCVEFIRRNKHKFEEVIDFNIFYNCNLRLA
jgi:hypothetical protein